jgi:serine/threonine protein kinase
VLTGPHAREAGLTGPHAQEAGLTGTELLGSEAPATEREVLESEVLDSQSSGEDLLSALTLSLVPGTEVLGREHAGVNAVTPIKTESTVENSGAPDDRSGDVIHGRYQLVRQLGKGGMGTVYIARHTTLPKTFAVKLLNARYAKRPDIAERFFQEARAVSLISHDNVVGVIDFGREDDGSAFLVMEHLRGESLAALCKREAPLPWPRVQHIMTQLCRALQAAHAVGVVHRDVKPDNVLRVTAHDDPDFIKVLDFGLAKMQVSGGARLTATGMVLGTPDYMSPEQARGVASDHRADIYAAGVLMYELLCRRVPFSGTNFAQIRQKHLLEPPEPPSKWQAWITEEIDAIVLRALAKDPAHRFASMTEMGAAIESVGTGQAAVSLLERPTLPLMPAPVFTPGQLAERSVIGDGKRAQQQSSSPPPTIMLATDDVDRTSEAEPASDPGAARRLGALAVALLGMAVLLVGVTALFATGVLGGADRSTTELAPASAPEPTPAAAPAPERAVLQFETNVPVVVADLEGHTPFGDQPTRTVSLPRSDAPMHLVLRADGYRDLHVVVTPNQDQIFAAQLEPLPTADPAPADPAPAVSPEPTPRERSRTKKPEPQPQPEPDSKPEPKPSEHSFSPEIRDPFKG